MKEDIKSLILGPEIIFLIAALMIFLVSFLFWRETLVVDIVGLTIFMDGITTIYSLTSIMVMYWVLYKISRRFLLSEYLIWLRVIITVGIAVLFVSTGKWFLKSNADSDLQAVLIRQLMINSERPIRLTSTLGVLFVFGQIIYLINLLAGISRKHVKSGNIRS